VKSEEELSNVILYSTERWVEVFRTPSGGSISIGGTLYISKEFGLDYNEPEVGDFDVVVSVANVGTLQASKPHRVVHISFPIADGPIFPPSIKKIETVVDAVSAAVYNGSKVLVRCRAGCNRSAFIAALAILQMRPGRKAEDVIDGIRAVRGCALSNEHFVKHLKGKD